MSRLLSVTPLLLITALLSLCHVIPIQPVSCDSHHSAVGYFHHAVMDPEGKYNLYWRADHAREKLTVWVEVATKGWIGFGFSPMGGMIGADMVIGWVADDKVYFHVSITSSSSRPSYT